MLWILRKIGTRTTSQMEKIVILGGGESGVGAALLAKAKGFEVFLSDKAALSEHYKEVLHQAHIPYEEGQHNEEFILDADIIIKSPGIPDKVELIKKLKSLRKPIISEIEFAARYTNAKIVAITGSNGKTTTTLLTYHLLKNAGLNVGLAGNIGESFAKQVIEDTFNYFVLELSSFQLDNCFDFKANIAVLLNITPDHLDRYDYKFENYVASKFRVVQNMTEGDNFIFYQESEALAAELVARHITVNQLPVSLESNVSQGAFLENGMLNVIYQDSHFTFPQEALPIKGTHNAINAMTAILVAKSLEIANDVIENGLSSFTSVEHRLEPVRELNNVLYVNDSKATNVDSVFYALGSYDNPIILIMGGVDKGNDYSQIEELVKDKVKALICLGIDNHKLLDYFQKIVPLIFDIHDLKSAIVLANELATEGDVVVLSPACASFDLFKNYEDRGRQFKAFVNELN